jgi:carbon-monoxide dehydrogenase medium subunit
VRLWQVDGVCQATRIVLGAVGPAPLRARQAEASLLGQSLTAERIAQAAQLAASESSPVDDLRGSAWYRQRIIQVWVARALTKLAS